jgi:hypothetical protein
MMIMPPQLAAMMKPPHRALAEFLHGSAPDPATRAMAATTLVLSLWQVAGRSLTPQPPWMLLVNAGEAVDDPLDALADFHVSGVGNKAEPGKGECLAEGTSSEKAEEILIQSVSTRQHLRETAPNKTFDARQAEFLHAKATSTLYGQGLTRPYSRAWHGEQGWITEDNDEVILRLDGPADRVAFRKDVLSRPKRLLKPVGIGTGLSLTHKTLALSGSLTPDLCDAYLVQGLLGIGRPVFILPHLARTPLKGQPSSLLMLNIKMAARNCTPIITPSQLPPDPWCSNYERVLRNRLHFLPGDYSFAVLRLIRDLGPVCLEIVTQITKGEAKATPEEKFALFCDLYALSFRGIVLSIVGLAYHGLGFDPGCTRSDTLDNLREVRKNGSCTRRELQRKLRNFNAAELDTVLTGLACEGLVRPEEKKVTAVAPADFVATLHTRPELAEPELRWPKLMGKKES